MNNKKPGLKVKYETLVIIWAALLISQLGFLLLIFMAKPELYSLDFTKPPLTDQPLIILVFAAGAIALFVLSFVFRNQYMKRGVVDQDATCVQTGLVLACALAEACSLLGIILAFAFDYQYFFLWIALGIIGILFHFPRRDNLLAASYKQ